MNANKDPQPDEGLKAFEQRLMTVPLRRAPEGLLPSVLASASADRAVRLGQPATQTPRWPWSSWWRELIWPNPKAWGCVAIAWIVIAVAQISLPTTASSKPTVLARSARSHSVDRESFQRVREQREMLARLLTPPAPAPAVRGPEPVPQILYWKTKRQGNRENIV